MPTVSDATLLAAESFTNYRHLRFELEAVGVAKPIILTHTIMNLDLKPKYDISVFGHELWHFVGAANTRVKSELLLEAIDLTLKSKNESEFCERYNESLVPLWECLAYQAQLSRIDTPRDLKEAINRSLEKQPKLKELVNLASRFEGNMLAKVEKKSTLTHDTLNGYLYQTIDVLNRLGVDLENISQIFRGLFEMPKESITDFPTVTAMTSFISQWAFSRLDQQRPRSKPWKVVDIADPSKVITASIGNEEQLKTRDYVMQDVLYAESIRRSLEVDTQQLLRSYAFSILDDFGVGTPIQLVTVDSLDSPHPQVSKTRIHYASCEAMFLRLGEHIRKAELYLNRYAKSLGPPVERRVFAYVKFLKSLREVGVLLQTAENLGIDRCQTQVYLHLKQNLPKLQA